MKLMEWIIDERMEGWTIRHYLKEEHKFSRRILKSIKNNGGIITLNGSHVRLDKKLIAGDCLNVQFPKEEIGSRMVAEKMDLDIVFEDESILVIDKPAQVSTIPSHQHPNGTLANGILYHYKKENLPYTVHVVTRLDRNTTGLVLIAKHRYSHSLFSLLQKENQIQRTYYGIVSGKLEPMNGTIIKNIARKEGSIIERTVSDTGQEAITHYKTIHASKDYSLLDIQLETGRTHQIRVHFSSSGHPLVGDTLYGGSEKEIKRQALHCHHISFEHPFTKKKMDFHSPLPKDMKKIVTKYS